MVVEDNLVAGIMPETPVVDNKVEEGIIIKIEEVGVDQGIIRITGMGLGIEIIGGDLPTMAKWVVITLAYAICNIYNLGHSSDEVSQV